MSYYFLFPAIALLVIAAIVIVALAGKGVRLVAEIVEDTLQLQSRSYRRRRIAQIAGERARNGTRWVLDSPANAVAAAAEEYLSKYWGMPIILLPDDTLLQDYGLSEDDLLGLAIELSRKTDLWWPKTREHLSRTEIVQAEDLIELFRRASTDREIPSSILP